MRNCEPTRETLPSAARIATASTAALESDTVDGTLVAPVDTEPEDAGCGAGGGGCEFSAEHPMDTAASTITGLRLCLDIYLTRFPTDA